MKEKIKNLNVKEKMNDASNKFKGQSSGKKIAIISGIIAVLFAIIFTFMYVQENKYSVLFSNIDPQDAANISSELDKRKVSTKIKGNTIYVDKTQVDKLRLELAPTITDGSKGFELMDEGSSIGLTDEEFQIKKQRMIQGEIEKTIKSFPQVENARVHITDGESTVFEKDVEPGRAAVYLILKDGSNLDTNQVKSIISLVAGSTRNIPKENIDVIDGNMNLLSEGIIKSEAEGENKVSTLSIQESKNAEQELNKKLEISILKMLEPIFGSGKVKATVNTDLNFDSIVTTDLTIKPDKVAIKETRLKSTSNSNSTSGNGATDSNIGTNNGSGNNQVEDNAEESFEYEVGKTEIQTISTPGEVRRITASVAIDGDITGVVKEDVQKIVKNSIGMNDERGDSVAVVSMEFDPDGKAKLEEELSSMKEAQAKAKLGKAVSIWAVVVISLIILYLAYRYISNKKTNEILKEIGKNPNNPNNENALTEELENKAKTPTKKRRNYILGESDEMTLEEEVKLYASEKPDQVTEIIKTWLNE